MLSSVSLAQVGVLWLVEWHGHSASMIHLGRQDPVEWGTTYAATGTADNAIVALSLGRLQPWRAVHTYLRYFYTTWAASSAHVSPSTQVPFVASKPTTHLVTFMPMVCVELQPKLCSCDFVWHGA